MSDLRCTCREVLCNYVHGYALHPYRSCPLFGTRTPLAELDLVRGAKW